jgi:hypothetical protein
MIILVILRDSWGSGGIQRASHVGEGRQSVEQPCEACEQAEAANFAQLARNLT